MLCNSLFEKRENSISIKGPVCFLFDVHYVLPKKAKQYKDDCEIFIFDITRGGYTRKSSIRKSIKIKKS